MEINNKLLAGNSNISNLTGTYDMHLEENQSAQLFIKNELNEDSNLNAKITLQANSNLEFTLFDFNTNESTHNKLNFILEQESTLNVTVVSLNAKLTKSEITCDLNGTKSSANINVVSVADTKVDTTYNVVCNNNAKYTSGNIIQRAVAVSGGRNIFEATGYIAEDCSGAKNFQESRVLLLDGASIGDASPILLINHHDVEAGHAAGVSRVDDEELYYLMSRGIDKNTAERLMTSAFVRPVIDKIIDEQMQEVVIEKINKKVL